MRVEIDRLIEKYNYKKIFFVTEDEGILEYFKKKYNKNLIFYKSFRSKNNEAFKIYPRK